MFRRIDRLLLALIVPAFTACGGGAGGGGAPPVSAPAVTLVFPPASFLTETATPIRGTASDPDGVAGVTLAGTPASSGDAFAHWDLVQDFGLGVSPLDVGAVDVLGNAVADAVPGRVARRFGPLPLDVRSLEFDASSHRIVAFDLVHRALLAIDTITDRATVISGDGFGSGTALTNATSMVCAFAVGKAYVTSASPEAVVSVDLATGARTIATGGGVGLGVTLNSPRAVAVSAAANKGWVIDGTFASIIEFNLTTGDRSTLSGNGVGAGPAMVAPGALAVDLAGGRLFVSSGSPRDRVYAIDLSNGDRTLVSGGGAGSGPALNGLDELEYAPGSGLLYVVNYPYAEILSIVPATGVRTIVTSPNVGSGVSGFPNGVFGLALDVGANRLFTAPPFFGGLIAADLTTGDRTIVYRPGIGSGPLLSNPLSAALDVTRHRLIATTLPLDDLVTIDMATGDRASLTGVGPSIANTVDVAVDTTGDRLIVLSWDGAPGLVAVDPTTGARTTLSNFAVGTGPALGFGHRLAVHSSAQVAYVADGGASSVVRIDLQTGNRSLLADAVTGSGPLLSAPFGIAVHPTSGIVFVGDSGVGAARIVAIDPATGVRTVVSGDGVGTGLDLTFVGDLSWDAFASRLVVASFQTVVSVDPSTGDRTTLVSNGTGTGPAIREFLSVDRDPTTGLLWMLDHGGACILVADPATGDRVVASK